MWRSLYRIDTDAILTLAVFAKKTEKSSQSSVAKMEADDPTVSLDLLLRSLLALGASNRDLGQIIGRG